MKGFFDKIGKDVQKAIGNNNSSKSNKNHRGGGQSLGGAKAGKLIPDIWIVEPGPIGVKLENTSQNHAIVAGVTPGGVAESVGLQRGDVICHPGTGGDKEMNYFEFLKMVKSNSRPLQFDVRRMTSLPNASNQNLRADDAARRQAVIAAAEERNTKHKARTRPIPKKKGGKIVAELTPEEMKKIELQKEENMKRNAIHMSEKPLSEEAERAVQAAKKDEVSHTNQLGYNPYETKKVTAGQASTASIAMTHGVINAGGNPSNNIVSNVRSSQTAIPPVQAPADAMISTDENELLQIDPAFDEAFSELITINPKENISKSLRIMKKLISNATSAPADDPKRKVRISDPNNLIKASIIDMSGAVELMLSVGFAMTDEDDGKMFLHYNEGLDSGNDLPWLKDALKKMEKYENDYK